jgi:hypothetical protein
LRALNFVISPHFEPHHPDLVALRFHFSSKNKLIFQYLMKTSSM